MYSLLRRVIFGVEQICADTWDGLLVPVDKVSGCWKAVILASKRRKARLRAPAQVEHSSK